MSGTLDRPWITKGIELCTGMPLAARQRSSEIGLLYCPLTTLNPILPLVNFLSPQEQRNKQALNVKYKKLSYLIHRKCLTHAKCATRAPKNWTHANSITHAKYFTHARLPTQNYLQNWPTTHANSPTTHDSRPTTHAGFQTHVTHATHAI